MSIIILIATLTTIATVMAFVINQRTPEPTAASMLRRKDAKGDNR